MLKVIDLSAGTRGIWFDKNYPFAAFVDIRPEVKPDIVADSRDLPASVGCDYDLVVFDPPHVNFGATANKSKNYGHHTTKEIRDIIHRTALWPGDAVSFPMRSWHSSGTITIRNSIGCWR